MYALKTRELVLIRGGRYLRIIITPPQRKGNYIILRFDVEYDVTRASVQVLVLSEVLSLTECFGGVMVGGGV